MEIKEAIKIYRDFKEIIEYSDKMISLFGGADLPESMLPYPVSTIDEALCIVEQEMRNKNLILEATALSEAKFFHLSCYHKDNQALESMFKHLEMMMQNDEYKQRCLDNLKRSSEIWREGRDKGEY
jgi:hypothetical protein